MGEKKKSIKFISMSVTVSKKKLQSWRGFKAWAVDALDYWLFLSGCPLGIPVIPVLKKCPDREILVLTRHRACLMSMKFNQHKIFIAPIWQPNGKKIMFAFGCHKNFGLIGKAWDFRKFPLILRKNGTNFSKVKFF